jgi:hypothetical protein
MGAARHNRWNVPGGALTETDYHNAVEAGGFTGKIIVEPISRLYACRQSKFSIAIQLQSQGTLSDRNAGAAYQFVLVDRPDVISRKPPVMTSSQFAPTLSVPVWSQVWRVLAATRPAYRISMKT